MQNFQVPTREQVSENNQAIFDQLSGKLERIDGDGLHVSFGPARERPEVIACDTVVLCAGQVSERSLADALEARGRAPVVLDSRELLLDPPGQLHVSARQ